MRASFLIAIIIATLVPIGSVSGAKPGSPIIASTPAVATFDKSIAATKASMMTDPQKALGLAAYSLRLAEALPPSRQSSIAVSTAQWLQAEAFIGINANDRAKPIVDAAIASVERNAPNTKLHGDLMRSRGALAAAAGQVQEALADFQRAHEIFRRAGELRSQAIALQDIGQIYLDAGDYQRVLDYYAQSAEVFSDDPFLMLTMHNNRAEVLREMNRMSDAVAEFRAALIDARKVESPLLETRILTNLALAQVDAKDLAGAERSLVQATKLSASGEARGWQPFVFGAGAKVAAARGRFPDAARLLERAFAGTDITKTAMPYREFHELAAVVYEKLGNGTAALANLRAFQRLDDDARKLTASTNAQLMAARFDFTNQNLKISTLKQGQLQRDIEIERQRSTYRTVILGGLLVAGAIVFGLLLTGYFSIRRSRNEVRAANDTLTSVNGKLEKALKAKTEFLATTSHEIRTPLNGILGMTQVLLADKRVDPDVRSKVQVVHGAGEAMRALVDDILDVAKMETGEVTIAMEETNLAGILNDAIRLWGGQAELKGLDLCLMPPSPSVPSRIISDETRLRQIVFNLMSNAVKFTLQGSVKVEADVEANGPGEDLTIRVSDTGIGIAEEHHDAIFEAFRQVDGGTSRQFGGTGLGLAICRRLATALGGTVTVRSTPHLGSTFTLRIPLKRSQALSVVSGDGSDIPTLASARLLLVERNPLSQSIMRAVLGSQVGSFEVTESAPAAIAGFASQNITHLLADAASAADEAGSVVDALRDLAAAARDRGILCSILFAPSETLTLADLIGIGATQIIAKPIDGATLIDTLRTIYPIVRDADPAFDVAPMPQKSAA